MENREKEYTEISEMLKVMAHPVRLCIINGLIKKGECNVTHMQNCLGKPQSTISQHLQKMRTAGIIESRRDGLEIYYRIKDQNIKNVMEILCKESGGNL